MHTQSVNFVPREGEGTIVFEGQFEQAFAADAEKDVPGQEEHKVKLPTLALNFPASQAMHESPERMYPAEQTQATLPNCVVVDPVGHLVQPGEPAVDISPILQSKHVVASREIAILPAAHWMQVVPAPFMYPNAHTHCETDVEPIGMVVFPIGHVVQSTRFC